MERRAILQATGVAAVTAFTGCLDTESGTATNESTDDPTPTASESAAYEAPIRELWAAYNNENVSGMRAAYHSASPQGVAEDEVNFGNEVSITGFSVVERSESKLTVEANATVTERGETQTVIHTYELRREDGEWAVWRYTVGPSDSSDQSRPTTPQVAFSFEYDGGATGDSDTGVLTITHTGGDSIEAAALVIRGDGIVAPAGAQPAVTARGTTWADATEVSTVTAGDSVTVGVESDCEISLVWQAPDGDTSATLATYDGPAA